MDTLLRDDHTTLKTQLRQTPENKLYLLQARHTNGERWRFVYKKDARSRSEKQLFLEFMTVHDITQFCMKIRQDQYEYRIVRVTPILPDGSMKPIPVESVGYFPKRA